MARVDLAETYRSYGAMIYRRCRRILRDEQEALDVTQETFVRALRQQHALRPGRELLAWLYRVATNLCFNRLRDTKFRLAIELPAVGEGGAESAILDAVLGGRLLSRFDETTLAIGFYVWVDGMTHDEAAFVAGVSARTVRNKLSRLRELGREPAAVGAGESP